MFECYLDGMCVRVCDTEEEASWWCATYDGDKSPSYDYIGDDEPEYIPTLDNGNIF